ncbi:MAG TPA: PHB depolymerase family esterase [Streptomyces sp.]|nr:PHB depolymerase family esterase [Streptomyces sp.]
MATAPTTGTPLVPTVSTASTTSTVPSLPAARTPLAAVLTVLAVLATAVAVLAGPAAPRASAAGLERVTSFGSNPGALSMYRYVPDGLSAQRPVVVVLHGCGQDAPGYFTGAGWQKFADQLRFSVVAPQQETANNLSRCFNWFQPADRSRGQGEALSIRQMVDRTVADLGADASRVYVTGLSAGGVMTASLLAAYPDVFAGGAVIAGLPHGCADSMMSAYMCMNPGVAKTPQQWGDLVRAAYPGYAGPRPPVSVWHGTADYTVASRNATESMKQWTNVLGADQQADATQQLEGGTTRSDYRDGSGATVVRTYLVSGMGHGTPVRPGSGPQDCGQAGAYFLNSICSSHHIAHDWGLAAG